MVSLQAIFQTPARAGLVIMRAFFAAKHHGECAVEPRVSG
jgi:hypothetical protein